MVCFAYTLTRYVHDFSETRLTAPAMGFFMGYIMKTYTEEEYRTLEQQNIILLKNIEKLEVNERINLKMIGEDTRFRFKIVKTLLAMSRRLNLLPDARQAGFFHEDASLNDITDFAEKCLERLKEAHNRDNLIENLGKGKVKWQETAESLDTAVNNARNTFEDIRIWMESLCLALGISLSDLKGKPTSQTISAAIKKLIHEKAKLKKESDWLAKRLSCVDCPKSWRGFDEFITDLPCPPQGGICHNNPDECWRKLAQNGYEANCADPEN